MAPGEGELQANEQGGACVRTLAAPAFEQHFRPSDGIEDFAIQSFILPFTVKTLVGPILPWTPGFSKPWADIYPS